MKLTIEKINDHTGPRVRFELLHDTSKKPVVFECPNEQIDGLLLLCQQAKKAAKFKVTVEL